MASVKAVRETEVGVERQHNMDNFVDNMLLDHRELAAVSDLHPFPLRHGGTNHSLLQEVRQLHGRLQTAYLERLQLVEDMKAVRLLFICCAVEV